MVNMVEETEDDHVHALRVGGEPGREVCRKQIELLLRTSMRYQRLERPLRRILIQIESEISIDFNMWSLSSMSWKIFGDGTADLTG